ncbi:MAG: protein kinase [Nannocystaceae bacterium]
MSRTADHARAGEVPGDAPIAVDAFDLDMPFGAGGMGVVWRGHHRDQGTPVAVKVIGASWSENTGSRAAFRREVRAIAGLTHPGIVAVYDLGQIPAAAAAASRGRLDAGAPYLVMELVSRGALDRVLGLLDWPLLRQLCDDVLDALAHAHAHDIIHCDIKPANVLLSVGPGDRVSAKLTDFGVAHAFTPAVEGDRPVSAGTPAYMPPEQLCGRWRDYGPWTDLYALACMIWELCCGRLPFTGGIHELVDGHLRHAPPAFAPLFAVPEGLEAWLRRLLAKGIGERYACAADARWALSRLDEGARDRPPILWADLDARAQPASASGSQTSARDACDPADATAVVPAKRFTTVDIGTATTMASDRLPTGERPPPEAREVTTGRARAVDRPPWPVDHRRPRSARHGDDQVDGAGLLGGAGLGLFGLRAIPLVDRLEERDLLWNALASVHALGQPRAIVVRGPSGVGKSRLVEWLAIRAQELGAATVLRATHAAIGGPEDGLAPMLARALRAHGLSEPGSDAAELFAHLLDVVERLTPTAAPEVIRERVATIAALIAPEVEAAEAWPRVRFASDRERERALVEVLRDLAARRPLLVWLDDAMWGPPALALAQALLRAGPLPALILATIRDEHVGDRPQAARLLAELEGRDAGVDVLTVSPLAARHHRLLVSELLGFDGELVDAIARRTLGNPMFAVELVGDWVERGLLVPTTAGFQLAEGATVALPDDLHELWSRRIDQALRGDADPTAVDAARRALELAATLGAQVDAEEWRDACARAEAVVGDDWIERLFRQRLAVATPRGFAFVHGMLRESLVRLAADAGRLVGHHRACAAMLQGRYGDRPLRYAERLARHRIAAGDGEAAIDPLIDACYRLQLTGAYQRAEAILDDLGALFDRLELDADDLRRLRAAVQGAWLRWMRGSASDAAARTAEVEALEAWARRLGAAAVVGDLLRLRGLDARFAGDFATSEELLQEAIARCDEAGDREGAARAHLALAASLRAIDRLGDSEAHLEAAIAGAEALELSALLPRCYGHLAEIALRRQRWDEAHRWFDRARASAEAVGDRKALAFAHGGLGDLAIDERNLEAALAHYRRAELLFAATGSRYARGVRLNAGVALLLRGRDEAARRVFVDHLAHDAGDRLLDAQAHLGLAVLAGADDRWEGDADSWDAHLTAASARLGQTRERRPLVRLLLERGKELAAAADDTARVWAAQALLSSPPHATDRPS